MQQTDKVCNSMQTSFANMAKKLKARNIQNIWCLVFKKNYSAKEIPQNHFKKIPLNDFFATKIFRKCPNKCQIMCHYFKS